MVLAGSTRSDLRRQVQYLKAENEILRSKLGTRVPLTGNERARLARLGRAVGPAIRTLVSIVAPGTIVRWINSGSRTPPEHAGGSRRKPGRPRTHEHTRRIILRIARDTGWGYTRILGELKKLGISVSRSTVVNILQEAGLPIGPDRGEPGWNEFMRSHAKTLWACDFMVRRIVTPRGLVNAFVLVFIHVASRRAIASTSTTRPDAHWVSQQVSRFAATARADGGRCGILFRDCDAKFGRAVDSALRAVRVTPLKLPHLAPHLNAHAERLIQTMQVECLDRFVACGNKHLDRLVARFVVHYNNGRPHSAIEHRTPTGPPSAAEQGCDGRVACRSRLGVTLRHYYRRAA